MPRHSKIRLSMHSQLSMANLFQRWPITKQYNFIIEYTWRTRKLQFIESIDFSWRVETIFCDNPIYNHTKKLFCLWIQNSLFSVTSLSTFVHTLSTSTSSTTSFCDPAADWFTIVSPPLTIPLTSALVTADCIVDVAVCRSAALIVSWVAEAGGVSTTCLGGDSLGGESSVIKYTTVCSFPFSSTCSSKWWLELRKTSSFC